MTAQPLSVQLDKPKTDAFLSVRDLRVHFPTADGLVKSVDGLSFDVSRGEILGIVGESGSGKSVTSQAILGLHKGTRARITGEIWLDGTELVGASEEDMRSPARGQDGDDLSGSAVLDAPVLPDRRPDHRGLPGAQPRVQGAARKRAVEMLDRVGIPNPEKRFDDYPHQFSGGMRQRAMIAMALVCDPKLLIADEPTTALDVTVQAQILDLMKDLQREFNSAIILITHDLGVVAETCDKVVVMYGGQCVETGTVEEIFYQPEMPYAWGLLGSMPRMDRQRQERLQPIAGQPPSLIRVPKGCVFNPRCRFQDKVPDDLCITQRPELLPTGNSPSHSARCHINPDERRRIWADEIQPTL